MPPQLYVFGTGHAFVTRYYNSCFALRDAGEYFLLDAGGGNGILSAMEAMEVPPEALRHMFLSHAHTDHILGAPWIIRLVGHSILDGRFPGDFSVWSHASLIAALDQMCQSVLSGSIYSLLGRRIHLHSIEDGALIETSMGQVRFFDLACRSTTQFGCCLHASNGQRLTYLGDEPLQNIAPTAVQGSDWLITEAMCLYEERHIHHPYEAFHSTVRDACRRANELHIPRLVLTHTEDSHGKNRRALYLREGSQYYHGTLFVPDDRDILDLV